jgi:demethylmenaquinone methyltransferase/2-methoxy-6-polyprenyl-1,4-benzoquinol methylase
MFGRLVPNYDRMNRIISFGMDRRWRVLAAQAAQSRGARVLDLGSGTGDLARELIRQGAAYVVGGDFSPDMLAVASRRHAAVAQQQWAACDVLHLPFADASFDCVTNGFLLRNVVDLPAGFAEMARVLRPGGRLVCLDMTRVPPGLFAGVYGVYFRHIMPAAAGLLSGDRAAYRYLATSLDGFPDADALAGMLRGACLRESRTGASVAVLHVATK